MNFLVEFIPIVLFFIAFKVYDFYVATIVGIAATLIQVIVTRLWTGKWDRKQLITLAVFTIFGSMTLYFHNPIFVKWKPTVIFWIFALALIISQWVSNKPLIQRMMGNILEEKGGEVPHHVWIKLNIVWSLFFLCLGGINLFVAYHFSNDAWVNFKFYGVSLALFFFSLFQAFYLMRYLSETKVKHE